MSRTYVRIAGVVLLTLLAFPSVGRASIIDIIIKMSGPQMIGFPIHCEYNLNYKEGQKDAETGKDLTKTECRWVDYRFSGNLPRRSYRRWWLSLDTTPFVSTGKNSGPNDANEYRAFENYMVAFEPLVEVRSGTTGDWSFHHGLVGVSYDVLFGSNFGTFDKFGFRFRPVGVTYRKKVNFALTIRWYPNGFTADEFGALKPRLENVNRANEFLYGFSVGYLLK